MAAVTLSAPRAGEHVIIYEGFQKASYVILKPGGVFNNRFGAFHHDDLIGAQYGARISTRTRGSTGFVHMLPFTPELWTLSLTHRTQILYGIDIAAVCSYLNLQPGCVVIESGTGSGSLTASLARAVGAGGHVNTFEFNADRATKSAMDFRLMGLGDRITVRHRDVCGPEGFSPVAAGSVDAVFLDLPQPWHALPHAKAALRACGSICSFSPCIEQVQRCCAALTSLGFEDVRTFEVLLRPFDVQAGALPPADPLFVPGAASTIKAAPVAPSSADASGTAAASAGSKRRRDEATAEGEAVAAAGAEAAPESAVGDGEKEAEAAAGDGSAADVPAPSKGPEPPSGEHRKPEPPARSRFAAAKGVLLRPETAIRGHTGYLTFAVLYPRAAAAGAADSKAVREEEGAAPAGEAAAQLGAGVSH